MKNTKKSSKPTPIEDSEQEYILDEGKIKQILAKYAQVIHFERATA